jgi:Cu-processing system permease protein
MRAIWIIGANTFREIIRDRILYGIVVFALLLIGLSLALGNLSFTEEARISADFGFSGIQLAAAILGIFVGSSLVAKEIDKQTILTLLARPLSRTQFLLGKFLGLSFVVAVVMTGLALVLAAIVMSLKFEITSSFVIALYGMFLESVLLIAISLFFGMFSRPTMTVIFSFSMFLIGHWTSSMDEIAKRSQSGEFQITSKALKYFLPNFEVFNWKSAPIYGQVIPSQDVLVATIYFAGWVILLISAAALIFRRRDFV